MAAPPATMTQKSAATSSASAPAGSSADWMPEQAESGVATNGIAERHRRRPAAVRTDASRGVSMRCLSGSSSNQLYLGRA